MFGTRLGTKPKIFYHGTDEEAALKIQEQGFIVRPAGGLLGRGVYCTSTLDKAMEYAKGPHGGIVLELVVDLGNCKELVKNDPMMTSWQSQYDSAWAPFSANNPNAIGKEENCVKDPKRIKVVRAIGRNMGALHRGSYDIVDGKLIRIRHGYTQLEQQRIRRAQQAQQFLQFQQGLGGDSHMLQATPQLSRALTAVNLLKLQQHLEQEAQALAAADDAEDRVYACRGAPQVGDLYHGMDEAWHARRLEGLRSPRLIKTWHARRLEGLRSPRLIKT